MDISIHLMDTIIHPTFIIIHPMDDNKHTNGYYNPSMKVSILGKDNTIHRKDYSKLLIDDIKRRMNYNKRKKDYIIHHFLA